MKGAEKLFEGCDDVEIDHSAVDRSYKIISSYGSITDVSAGLKFAFEEWLSSEKDRREKEIALGMYWDDIISKDFDIK